MRSMLPTSVHSNLKMTSSSPEGPTLLAMAPQLHCNWFKDEKILYIGSVPLCKKLLWPLDHTWVHCFGVSCMSRPIELCGYQGSDSAFLL